MLDLSAPDPPYEASATHQNTETVEVRGRDDELLLEISEYGGVGPTNLWAFKMAVHAVVEGMDWRSEPEAGDAKR